MTMPFFFGKTNTGYCWCVLGNGESQLAESLYRMGWPT
jgi:hypothetical protein